MSEQEKNNNVTEENAVAEAKKENFFKRAWKNPKVRKALSWAGRIAEGAFIGAICYSAGKKSVTKPIPVEGHLEPAEDDEEDAE